MSQSVKLSDGSYIDSTGVYDTSLGMTQQAINNAVSHVGQIIFSTTLDTMEKVVAVYGGTTWSKIEGRFLVGASSSYANGSTGGSSSHQHTYGMRVGGYYKETVFTENTNAGLFDYSDASTYALSGYSTHGSESVSMNNAITTASKTASSNLYNYTAKVSATSSLPPYRAVYIWERTA
jgi:hypothetical protein